MTENWQDDPAVREAIAAGQHRMAMPAQRPGVAEAELAAHGLYPVSVAHGELGSDEAVDLICGQQAERLGCVSRVGYNDSGTWLFRSQQAAAEFVCEVAGFMLPWWTVTETARPVYDKLDGLAATLMPGLRDSLPEVIGPRTDWERAVNAWCSGRASFHELDGGPIGSSRDPGAWQQAALRRLGPAFRAARLGHTVEWTPQLPPEARRWTCVWCYAPVHVQGGQVFGYATTRRCPGRRAQPR